MNMMDLQQCCSSPTRSSASPLNWFRRFFPAAILIAASVNCLAAAPSIQTQPQSTFGLVGSNVTFSVSASGDSLSYQWLKDGSNVSGATGTTLLIANISSTDAGTYTVTITNFSGSV